MSASAPPLHAGFGHERRKQFHRVADRHRVVQRPPIRRAGPHHLVEREGDTACRSLHRRQPRIEHLPRAGQANLLRHLRRRRNPLHQHAQLMPRRRPQRLQIAHDPVAAIHGVMQLVARLAKTVPAHAAVPTRSPHRRWRWCTGSRIPTMPTEPLADLARAFQLHPQLLRRHEARPRHPRGPLVDLLVHALAHVQCPPRKYSQNGFERSYIAWPATEATCIAAPAASP